MTSTSTNIFIAPGEWVSRSDAGILFPLESQRPYNFGVVLAAGPGGGRYDMTLTDGDVVAYHMMDPGEVDGVNKKLIEIDGESVLVMDEALVQCKIKNPEMKRKIGEMIKAKERESFFIDYGTDVEMCGFKVAIELKKPDEKTASGIILPEFKMNKAIANGRIVAISDQANKIFANPNELKVGMDVLIDKSPSGGMMPMSGDKVIWRLNSHEIAARFDEESGAWVPVGGRIFIRPLLLFMKKIKQKMPHATLEGVMRDEEFWIDTRRPNILMPITTKFIPQQGEVVAVGGGWSEHYGAAKAQGDTGTPPYGPGDVVLHLLLQTNSGELMRGAELIEINGEELFLVPTNIVEGVLKDGERLSELKKLALRPAWHGL